MYLKAEIVVVAFEIADYHFIVYLLLFFNFKIVVIRTLYNCSITLKLSFVSFVDCEVDVTLISKSVTTSHI